MNTPALPFSLWCQSSSLSLVHMIYFQDKRGIKKLITKVTRHGWEPEERDLSGCSSPWSVPVIFSEQHPSPSLNISPVLLYYITAASEQLKINRVTEGSMPISRNNFWGLYYSGDNSIQTNNAETLPDNGSQSCFMQYFRETQRLVSIQ